MTLTQLECFYALCKTQSVSKAAAKLHKSQAALSLSIAKLESLLGEKLFERIGKSLRLNERGRLFYEKTLPHYRGLIEAGSLFERQKIAGVLHVAASKTIANYLLPPLYYDFATNYKEVSLRPQTRNSTAITEGVKNGQLDIGFIENTPPADAQLQARKIASDRLLVVSSDAAAPKKAYIDTLGKQWIMREKGSGTREYFMAQAGIGEEDLPVFMELGEFEAIKTVLLQRKDCIGVLSEAAARQELAQNKLYITQLINIDLQRDLYMIYRRDKNKSLLFQTFGAFITNALHARDPDVYTTAASPRQ